jgi:predicted Fe-Mo cluster-binding NifX family protein
MLIAVASKSKSEVDQHFGHAESFLVYDCKGGEPKLLREETVEKYCSYDPDHVFRKPQFQAITDALADCKVVMTMQIGDYPLQELVKAGLNHVAATGSIEDALLAAHATVCGCGCKGPKSCTPGQNC